jgi:hypothetical protein
MSKRVPKHPEGPEPKRTGGQRVHQEKIDKMTALRVQGFSYPEIAERVGCSVRTVQRYATHVQPRLHIPAAGDQLPVEAGRLRAVLLKKFVGELFHDRALRELTLTWKQVARGCYDAIYGGPISTRFMVEAERLFQLALRDVGSEMLQLLGNDSTTQQRFVRDTIGELRTDYERWLYIKQNWGSGFNETGEDWRPRRERPLHESKEVDELWTTHSYYEQ